jgi:nickel/cobalt exporter
VDKRVLAALWCEHRTVTTARPHRRRCPLTAARAVVTGAALLIVLAATASGASAHPLGNFTTNTATELRIAPDVVEVDRVLDLAEVPALQAIQAVDGEADEALTGDEAERFAAATCAQLRDRLTLAVDGRAVPLEPAGTPVLTFPPGEAGLDTLRLECPSRAEVDLAAGSHDVTFTDAAYPDRLGWREVTARGNGVELVTSDVPATSSSGRLTAYPEDRLSSPLDQREAALTVRAGGASIGELSSGAGVPEPVARGLDRLSSAFTDLVAVERLTVPYALLAIVIAMALGTLHAFAPGHGKTVIAAYLVGQQGTAREAFLLGGTVAVTHTLGVFLLGTVLSVTTAASPASIYPWLGAASGLLFTAVGVTLLRQARRTGGHVHGPGGHVHGPDGRIVLVPLGATPPAVSLITAGPHHDVVDDHPHARDHGHADGHGHADDHSHADDHDHAHPHDHDRSATDAVVDRAAAGRGLFRGLLAPGLAGGLVPSPSALLVLLGGFAIGRAWFGVSLVVAYGVGMAATLVGAGYVLVRLRTRLDRTTADGPRWRVVQRVVRRLPILTSTLIIIGGLVIAVRSVATLA